MDVQIVHPEKAELWGECVPKPELGNEWKREHFFFTLVSRQRRKILATELMAEWHGTHFHLRSTMSPRLKCCLYIPRSPEWLVLHCQFSHVASVSNLGTKLFCQ